jgi:hypothetical protein
MKEHKTPPGIAGRAPRAVVDGAAAMLVDFAEFLKPYADFLSGVDGPWERRHPEGFRCNEYASADAMEKSFGWRSDWRGGIKSMGELRAIFAEGWGDYFKKGGAMRSSMVSGFQAIEVPESKLTRQRDKRRGRPNVRRFERWRQGQYHLPIFDRTRRTGARVRGLRLYVPFVYDSGQKESAILTNGIAACGMAEALTMAGWQVELIGWSATHKPRVTVLYQIMKPGQRVAWDRIAAGLAHPGTFRTFGIAAFAEALIANDAELPHDVNVGGGYGVCRTSAPQDELDEVMEALGVPTPGYTVALPFMGTERKAIDAIQSVCHAIRQAD